jgi:hypothetical protein
MLACPFEDSRPASVGLLVLIIPARLTSPRLRMKTSVREVQPVIGVGLKHLKVASTHDRWRRRTPPENVVSVTVERR